MTSNPLPVPLERAALGAFIQNIRFPMARPTVYRSTDTWIEDEWGATLVFSGLFNRTRRFAVLVIPKSLPPKVLEYAGATAASILNGRLRREKALERRVSCRKEI